MKTPWLVSSALLLLVMVPSFALAAPAKTQRFSGTHYINRYSDTLGLSAFQAGISTSVYDNFRLVTKGKAITLSYGRDKPIRCRKERNGSIGCQNSGDFLFSLTGGGTTVCHISLTRIIGPVKRRRSTVGFFAAYNCQNGYIRHIDYFGTMTVR